MRDEKLARLTDVDLLIVGDLGLRPLKGDQPIDLYEFVRLRYEHGSTIITSNRDTDELHHHLFGDPLLASAAMHRLLHRAYRAQIVEFCDFLYGIAKVPKKWVFNSFGHLTCYLYRDLNDNGRMDGKEKIHGELIHATPENEADDWLGMQVDLGDSHGCIHVKPADIDDMINRKFLKKGALVVVHRYDEARIPYAKPKSAMPRLTRSTSIRACAKSVPLGSSGYELVPCQPGWLRRGNRPSVPVFRLAAEGRRGSQTNARSRASNRPNSSGNEWAAGAASGAPAAPEADAPLVRRLHALATAWNDEAAPQRINDSLAVHLAEDNGSWSGTSSRWPMVVAYHPKGADQRESLHVSFTTLPSLTLADLQGQFGPPAHQIKSKESLVDFNGPSGVRVVVGLLGGLTPESAVSWIRLEEPGRRKPPPKDLF